MLEIRHIENKERCWSVVNIVIRISRLSLSKSYPRGWGWSRIATLVYKIRLLRSIWKRETCWSAKSSQTLGRHHNNSIEFVFDVDIPPQIPHSKLVEKAHQVTHLPNGPRQSSNRVHTIHRKRRITSYWLYTVYLRGSKNKDILPTHRNHSTKLCLCRRKFQRNQSYRHIIQNQHLGQVEECCPYYQSQDYWVIGNLKSCLKSLWRSQQNHSQRKLFILLLSQHHYRSQKNRL